MPPRENVDIAAVAQRPQYKPQLMLSQPGVQRDGTKFSRASYIDAMWNRFWMDKPKKMGGYREQVRDMIGVSRHLNLYNTNGFCYVHTGSTEAFQRYAVGLNDGTNTGLIDRTPVGYTPSPDTLWQSDSVWDETGQQVNIFAAPTMSLTDITNETPVPVYYGGVTDTAVLVPAEEVTGSPGVAIETSGGLCTVGPYLFLYGAGGVVRWSAPFQPRDFITTGTGDSRPVPDKILKGMPIRGQSAPAIIMWSLSSVIVGNFVGGTTFWNFYTISTSGSLLSQNGIVEHNGVYYWASTNGFSMYSGSMIDIPNEYNQQFFLDNLNFSQRQKVFAMKIPRWKEIWWCFPFGNSDEPNHAVIYNYEKKYWYDTPLPNGGRGAGYYDVTFRFPIMTGVSVNPDTSGTSIWQHEIGVDEISGPTPLPKAVKAYFQTNEFNMILPQQIGQSAATNQISFSVLEPDFNQVGNLTLDIFSRNNARATTVFSPPTAPYTIPPAPTEVEPDGITFQWQQRLTSFRITSNEAGGDYFAGSPLIHMMPGRERRTQ